MNKQLKTIPHFANEAEERTYWESHDSTTLVDWSKAKSMVGRIDYARVDATSAKQLEEQQEEDDASAKSDAAKDLPCELSRAFD